MLKIIPPGSYDFGEPVVQLVKLSQRGLIGNDRRDFIKRASHTLAEHLDHIKLAAGEVPVLIVPMGSTEGYGSNRNGDGFSDGVCRRYHPTFVKSANWFRHHQNKDKTKSRGRLKLSAFNEDIKRIELVAALNATQEAADRNSGLVADIEIEKLARGEDIPVSMGCVLDPNYPVLTRDRGYVRIEDIAVGDMVWTHKGRWCRVWQLNRRPYTGEVKTFKVNGLPVELPLTADHPMWAKVFVGSRCMDAVKAKAGRFFKDTKAFEQEPAAWYHAEHVQVGDRFFYKPVTHYSGYGRIADADLAAVMGYYLAEGSFKYNGDKACTTQFNCNMTDSLPRVLPGLVQRMFADVTVDISARRGSDTGLSVDLHSTQFSEFLRQYVGQGCRHKTIAPEIFNAAREIKLTFLGAWIDGDGWFDKKGGHWSSASYELLLQGRDLLAAIGIPASIYRIVHPEKETGLVTKETTEYTLNISHLDAWQLTEYSGKAASYIPPTMQRSKSASMRICPDGSYAYRVSNVETRYVSEAPTYNFEVEEDESYSLGGLISHNCHVSHDICSGCHNKARFRSEYCDEDSNCKYGGLKRNIGRTFDDGKTAYAINPDPHWFDLSTVGRNADRIAFGLGIVNGYEHMLKAASDSSGDCVSGAELAQRLGLATPAWVYDPADPWVSPRIREQFKLAAQLIEAEESMHLNAGKFAHVSLAFAVQSPAKELPDMRREKVGAVLAALHNEGCLLPLTEFSAMLSREPREKIAEAVAQAAAALPGTFNRLVARPDFEMRLLHNPYFGTETPSSRLQTWAVKQASDWSIRRNRVVERLQLATIRQVQPLAFFAKHANSSEKAEELANEYGLYVLAFLASQPDTAERKMAAELVVHSNYCQ